jgi:glycosyltransferase involved in cell wall biosynthesis
MNAEVVALPNATSAVARRADGTVHAPLVALSTAGTFHTFDMARQLEKAGMLAGIHTGYPRFKLGATGLPARKIHPFPWFKGPYMAGWVPAWLRQEWEYWDRVSLDAYTAATLPECAVFCGLSGSGLRSGRTAQRRGARYVCDRGSSHIRYQDRVLREEYARWGMHFRGVDPRIMAREEAEYEQADAILVPSSFVRQSFVEMGVSPAKLRLAPYGVDLTRFHPVDRPCPGRFDMIFVGGLSLRKGAHYLFSAFEALDHAHKTLTIAGVVAAEIAPALERFAEHNPAVRVLGHVQQGELKHLMSRSHVLVLPSVEEGLALVQAQAMACACPVVATRNTGAENLYDDGVEGLIVEPRDQEALTCALQKLADDPQLRERFSAACLQRVAGIGGWDQYGRLVTGVFRELADPVHVGERIPLANS